MNCENNQKLFVSLDISSLLYLTLIQLILYKDYCFLILCIRCAAKGTAWTWSCFKHHHRNTLASVSDECYISSDILLPPLYSWCVAVYIFHSLPVLLLFDIRMELRGDILCIDWFVEFTASRKSLRFILLSCLALKRSSLFCNAERRSFKRWWWWECVYVGFWWWWLGTLDCSSVDLVSTDTEADNIAIFCWCGGRDGAWVILSDVVVIFSEVCMCLFADMLNSVDGSAGDIFLLEEVNRLLSDFVMMLVLM